MILETIEEQELWKQVAIAVASSSNATSSYSMYEWADKAVEYYRKRLPNKD